MTTEAQVLAHVMDRTRQYTLSYFDRLKDHDLHRRFECDGKILNSVFWIMAHLTASENGLLLMATGGPFDKFSWAKHFTVGSAGLPQEECPPIEAVMEMFHLVHAKAMAHLPTLTSTALEAPDPTGIPLIGTTVRDVITHAIRHEGSHVGHLGWLCKLHGVRTI
ncbi:MAG: DinB family protein [Flavobacteriales bacterium]|nr:DinB family protein [Flavobacteriales bacterium]